MEECENMQALVDSLVPNDLILFIRIDTCNNELKDVPKVIIWG